MRPGAAPSAPRRLPPPVLQLQVPQAVLAGSDLSARCSHGSS
jgi:hypothetical protein